MDVQIRELNDQLKQRVIELHHTNTLLEAILDSIAEGVVVVDANGKFLQFNPAAEQIVGLGARDVNPERWVTEYGLFQPDKVTPFQLEELPLARALRGEIVTDMEIYIRNSKHKDGVWISVVASPVTDHGGKAMGAVCVFRDITTRKQAEEEIVGYQRRLRSLAAELSIAEEQERRRIAVGLHDRIGQMLALTKLKLGQLNKVVDAGSGVDGIKEIGRLIDQTISATRSMTFELGTPTLYELGLEAALEDLASKFHVDHGLLWQFRDDGRRKPLTDDVRAVLFRAVAELLTNIVKHAKATQFHVSIARRRQEVIIKVVDNGKGFEIGSPTVQAPREDGFGFFSIRERLEHMGGHLIVESKPGEGTMVTLVGPLQTDVPPKESNQKKKSA